MFIHYAEVEQPKAHIVRLSLEIPLVIQLKIKWLSQLNLLDNHLLFSLLLRNLLSLIQLNQPSWIILTRLWNRALLSSLHHLCENFFEVAVIEDISQISELYKLYDMALTQRGALSAMLCSAKSVGTHGSAFVDRKPDENAGKPRQTRTLTRGACSEEVPVSLMPNPELWFETLLAKKKKEMEYEHR